MNLMNIRIMHSYKNIFLWIVGVLFLQSCKVTSVKPDDFAKPNQFGPSAEVKISNDTLKSLPLIKDYYNDAKLQSLLKEAVQNNFDVQVATQRLQESVAETRFFKGVLLPEVHANVRAGQRRFGTYTIDGVGNFDTQFSTNLTPEQKLPVPNVPDYYLGLSTQWEVDVWGKLRNLKKGALQRYLASSSARNAIQTQMVASVANHYYRLMILDYELQILEENKNIRENALEAVKLQKEYGRSNELGIELIQAQLHQVNALYLEVKAEILETENQINILCGRFPQAVERNAIESSVTFTKNLPTIVPSFVLQNRPDIQASVHEMHANNANVRAAQAAFYPSLQLSAAFGLHSFRSQFLLDTPESLANELFANLSAPLLNRRALKSQLMMSKAHQKKAYVEYQKTVVEAFTEVYGLLQKEKYFTELKQERKLQVDVLKKSIQTSQALFVTGRASFLEVITAQENYLQSQLQWLDAMTALTQNQVNLFKAIGGGVQ